MSANPYRGEVSLVIDGERQVMRLSLGALAVLEDQMGSDTLPDLVERFETGAFRARDILLLLAAGLGRSPSEMADCEIEGGPVAAARAAARLLRLTFELPEASGGGTD